MTGGAPPLGSTYRLQLPGTGFDGACELVPYLDALGVEVLYVSPVLAAVPGSSHGYDVVDPGVVDPALGGPEGLDRLLDALGAHGMRLLVDIVPNHLAASVESPWWWDVLRRGRSSPYAPTFDVDWGAHDGRILLPVLARPLDEVLAAGDLTFDDHHGGPALHYGDATFPVDPASLAGLADDGPPRPADVVHRQHYRLAHWRLGPKEGNYRRFFDVDGLVGVRQDDPEVYRATHRAVLRLVADPRVAGLRVDHVDGLADPDGYLERLRHDVASVRSGPEAVLVVEKILARGETPPERWPVEGTTGYEFADQVVGVLTAGPGDTGPDGPPTSGDPGPTVDPASLEAKRELLAVLFGAQFDGLVDSTVEALGPEAGTDVARADVARALLALTVHLPVYRTYFGAGAARAEDVARLAAVADRAAPEGDPEVARAVRLVADGIGSADTAAWRSVAIRWQQLSGALTAKAVEDTALYRVPGPSPQLDVGSAPGVPAVTVDAFHGWARARADRRDASLSATSTHDAKRGEDVRARLCVLVELGERWSARARRWAARLDAPVTGLDTMRFLESAVGIWPDGGPADERELDSLRERLGDYLVKAAREAKLSTTWLDPDPAYERGLTGMVATSLASTTEPLVADITGFLSSIGPAAVTTSLALTVLRVTVPGVPDTYQGTETWARSLVDPDNRRPVPFARLAEELAAVDKEGRTPAAAATLLRNAGDGRVKMAVLSALLRHRRAHADLYASGAYVPLTVEGPAAGHVVAAARRGGDGTTSVTVVPRLPYRLSGPRRFPLGAAAWGKTRVLLPGSWPDRWEGVVDGGPASADGGRLEVGGVLASLPVAVLVPSGC